MWVYLEIGKALLIVETFKSLVTAKSMMRLTALNLYTVEAWSLQQGIKEANRKINMVLMKTCPLLSKLLTISDYLNGTFWKINIALKVEQLRITFCPLATAVQ